MKRILCLLLTLPLLLTACAQQEPAPTTPAAAPGPAMKPYGNLAQMMRVIPFVHSNVIFDAQSNDPDARQAAQKAAAEKSGAPSYEGTYGGWAGVEESALALANTANLLLVPGWICSNGVPAPSDREDWKRFTQGLIDAGLAAQKAAQTKNLDAMVDVSGVVSDACLACHEIYRDQPEPKPRCTP